MRPFLSLLATSCLALADFPEPVNTETTPGDPMPAEEAAAGTKVPEGFEVTVFASEPMVRNPIACTWDSAANLWIAENFTYDSGGTQLREEFRDRVVLFKDTTGDGKADRHQVFTDELANLTSIEWTPEGLWVMCPPRLLFIPDENRDAIPDGPPQVILDGFTVPSNSHHNFANGLRIGPDGWLYGRCGASAPGEIGKPGTPTGERIPLRGTIWRYHRTRGTFEALASGTTNPWGHDWDEHGNLFFVNTVNGHLWHLIPGAHYVRSHTRDPNPHVYELLDMHADHWHFDTGGHWTKSRDGAANSFGGGHAHQGAMIYQGNNWPEEYRGNLYTLNFHGRRINREILKPSGSGFVASHGEDLFISPDPFFRGIDLTQGPHGEVYILDWSDTGECHENTGVHRQSGRIYRLSYGDPGNSPADPDWTARRTWNQRSVDIPVDGQDLSLPSVDAELVRRIRSLTDHWPLDTVLSERNDTPEATAAAKEHLPTLIKLADQSAPVRLQLASTLQRLPFEFRKDLALALVSHEEDSDDHNLPLMVWYGLIPLGEDHPEHLVEIFEACEWPKTRRFIARRLAEDLERRPGPINRLLELAPEKPPAVQRDLALGIRQATRGWQKADPPGAWSRFAENADLSLAPEVRGLAVLFGEGLALDEVRKLALDANTDLDVRKAAVRSLIQADPDDLRDTLIPLLDTRFLNLVAAEGLAKFDDPEIAGTLLDKFGRFHSSEREALIGVLSSRPAFARVLLESPEHAGKLSAFHARQIRGFNDDDLTTLLSEARGDLLDPDKAATITKLKSRLTPETLAAADLKAGRQQYEALCATCHKLYGKGGDIGPDLTGSGRDNLDYLLENIVDPSAVLTDDFRLEIITLEDGRILSGMIKEQTPRTLTLQTMTDVLTVEKRSIKDRQTHNASLMPEGLLQSLSPDQTRDLIAYLMHPVQVE